MIDMARGHPPAAALPGQAWAEATARTMQRHGAEALNYGEPAGPMALRQWLGVHVGVAVDEVLVTAGASHALDLLATLLIKPGDTVLVDAPTYHHALRLLAGHGAQLLPLPDDLSSLNSFGARMIYTVPTFGNPTGLSLPIERRAALVAAAADAGILIVEDDTYRELSYDDYAPPSLYSLTGGPSVARIGTFSKTVAPGLRLGWITATPDLVRQLSENGCLTSGGCLSHTTAVTMAVFAEMGFYDQHLTTLRTLYGGQRDALVKAVREHLPEATFEAPGGGWFLWLQHQGFPGMRATGVSYMEGSHFYPSSAGGADYVRLSFSMCDQYQLTEGVKLIAAALAT